MINAARPQRAGNARGVALDVLDRIDEDGAYANLAVGVALDRSDLSTQDRGFVTDLVYGTTRMRRACDVVADGFVTTEPDPPTRRVLRLGVYQLLYQGVAPHAAVGETVDLAPRRSRGFVNAVLRRVAALVSEHGTDSVLDAIAWPSPFARLSYPDWLGELVCDELGTDDALAALDHMNRPPNVSMRPDGYVQDVASTWVAEAVQATPGELVADLCAAPGGKATAMAHAGATVVAADVHPSRSRLIASNAHRTSTEVAVVTADGTRAPWRPETFDAVLVDAPCSGLGTLRRRPDARWRIGHDDIATLAALQRTLVECAATLVRSGGRLVYSVCTITAVESIDHPTPAGFEVDPVPPSSGVWRQRGKGWQVLPHDADTDGMTLIRYRRK